MFLRSAALLEGLRVDGEVQIGSVRLEPIALEAGFSGRELRQPFNALMADHGFVSEFDAPAWGAQIAPRRRLAFLTAPPLEVNEPIIASTQMTTAVSQLVDALALTFGGAPRMVAMVTERSDDGDEWSPWVFMVGAGSLPGSSLERLLPDGEQLPAVEPLELWKGSMASPLFGLWLSLHRGVAGEARDDVRTFRYCSLLEAIGRETVEDDDGVCDARGQPLLGHDGKPAVGKQLRGKMYLLVRRALECLELSERVALCHPSQTLWDEVGIWADIRNMVAHEGMWRPPPLSSALKNPQIRTAAAFKLAARGGGFDEGAARYAAAVAAATEAALRAATPTTDR